MSDVCTLLAQEKSGALGGAQWEGMKVVSTCVTPGHLCALPGPLFLYLLNPIVDGSIVD